MFRALKSIFYLTLIGLIASGGGFLYVDHKTSALGPNPEIGQVFIEHGTGLNRIAQQLLDEGFIANKNIFRFWARITGQHTKLRAGEFEIPPKSSIKAILDILQNGQTVVHKITFAEGLTVTEMLMMIQGEKVLSGNVTNIPDEGTMLPETYHYSRGDTRNALVGRMIGAMDVFVAAQWLARPSAFILSSPQEWLTLASIVEKETGIAEERPKVAAVFLNRLKRGMRLQSDPTVVFALTHGSGALGRALTRGDLKIDSPYNTYTHNGLPPAPIANPGRESLLAILNPAQSKALYFVADGTGGHVFAKTLKEHNRNVQKWRKIKHQLK